MARVSFVVRNTSAASGSFLRYPDGSASVSLFPSRTDYDSSLRADGFQLAPASTGVSTFSVDAITYGKSLLTWTAPIVAVSTSPLPTSVQIVYSPQGAPQTVASGTVLVDTSLSSGTYSHTDLPSGKWAYYSLFIHYTSTSGDDYYVKSAELEILIPTDYGSTIKLWDQLPSFVKSQDIALGDFNFSSDIGQTHGDAVGPLFKYLSIIGYDMDYMRTLIDYHMVSHDPNEAESEALNQLAITMGIPLTSGQLGSSRLRSILDNIGIYRRAKGTPAAVNLMLGAVSGSNSTYNATTHKYTIQSQRANYVTVPKTGAGLTTWRESYPGESTAGTALNILRGAEFFIDAGRAVNAEQAALNQGTGGSALNARYGTGTGVDASDPLLLTHTGTNYMYLPGVNGNYVSIPDNPSLNITGDIELVARASPASWTPTTYCTLAQKNNIWYFRLSTAGKLEFVWNNGTAYQIKNTTQSIPIAAGVAAWVKTTFTVATGQARFYYATDQATEPSVWTELTAPSAFGATTMVAGAGVLGLGSNAGGTEPWVGGMYRFIVRNGIAGPTVVDVDFTTGLTSGNQVSVPFTGTALATSTPQYVSNLGTGGRALVAKVGSTGNVDTNDPLLLPYNNENYLYTTGNTIPTTIYADSWAGIPDNGAMDLLGSNGPTFLSCTGGGARATIPNSYAPFGGTGGYQNIEIVMRIAVDAPLPGDNVLMSKGYGGTFFLALGNYNTSTNTANLDFSYIIDSDGSTHFSQTGIPLTIGTTFWLRATRNTGNGVCSVYVQPDQSFEPTSWGAASVGSDSTSGNLRANTADVSIGANYTGNAPSNVRIYRAILRNNINSGTLYPPIFDIDFTKEQIGSTAVLASGQGVSGVPMTLAGGAQVVDGSTSLNLTGINGNYASSPTSTPLSITGDFEILVKGNFDSAGPLNDSVNRRLVVKNSSYSMSMYNSNIVTQVWTSASMAQRIIAISPKPVGTMWLKWTYTASTGTSVIYSSTDNVTYTQIGIDTQTTNLPPDASSAALIIGANSSFAEAFVGTISRVIIRNTIGGVTPVFDADFTKQVELATSFNEGSTNNAVVTVTTSNAASKITSGTTFLHAGNAGGVSAGATVAFNAAHRLQGDFDVVFRCNPMTSASATGLVVRDQNWRVLSGIADPTKIALWLGDGVGGYGGLAESSPAALAVGTTRWYKVSRVALSGVVSFFYAADQPTEPLQAGWTAIGTATTTSGTTPLYPASPGDTQPVQIGMRDSNSGGYFSGRFYNVKLRDGIGTSFPTVMNVDFTQQVPYTTTSFIGGASAGPTVTLFGNSRIERNKDLELVVRVALDDWWDTAGVTPALIGRGFGSGDYNLWVTSTTIQMCIGTYNSSNFPNISWSTRPSNGSTIWIKATRSASTGVTTAYWAADSTTEPTSWTTIGTSGGSTTAGNTGYGGGYPVGIGANLQSLTVSSVWFGGAAGKFYRGIIRDGINGRTIVDVDFTKQIVSGAQTSVAVAGTSSQAVRNLGTTGAALNAKAGKYSTSLDISDPILLPHYGINYLYSPGGNTNNYAVTNYHAGLDITTDHEMVVCIAADVWLGTQRWLVCKGTSDNNANYGLQINSNSDLVWSGVTATGVKFGSAATKPHLLASDGQSIWFKMTRTNLTGEHRWYYSRSSPVAEPTSWTFISSQTIAATESLVTNANYITIGQPNGFSGKFYRAIVRSGIGGTVVYDADFTRGITSGGQTSFTEYSSYAATVTISRATSGRKAVAVTRSTWLFGTDDYMDVADNAALNFTTTDSYSIVAVTRQWNTPANFGRIISKGSGGVGPSYALMTGTGYATTWGVWDTAAHAPSAVSPASSQGTLMINTVVRSPSTMTTYTGNTAGTAATDTTTTSLSNTAPFRIGADYNAGGPAAFVGEMELVAIVVFRRALTTGEISTINSHYNGTETPSSNTLLAGANFWIDAARSPSYAAINRGTVGRKSVAVVRPTYIFGTNDYMEVIDNDLLDFGATDSFTVVAVARRWGALTGPQMFVGKGNATGGGYELRTDASGVNLFGINDGAVYPSSNVTQPVSGTLAVVAGVRNVSSDQVQLYQNASAGTFGTDTTTGAISGPATLRIGQNWNAVQALDAELFGAAVFRRALTATELALINTHYQGTETADSVALLSTAVFWIDPARSSQEMAINRSTTGKKAVAVTRPTWLLNSTYMEVADNDLIDFGSSQDFTMLVVTRVWNTPASYSYYIAKQVPNLPTGNKGYDIRNNVWPSVGGAIGDGTGSNNYNTFPQATATANPSSLMTLGMQRTGTSTKSFYNNTFGTPITNSYDMSNSGVLRIAGNLDAEFLAVAIFRRALTATEIAAINTYYGTV